MTGPPPIPFTMARHKHNSILLHLFWYNNVTPLTYFRMCRFAMKKQSKQVNPNNPGNVEDLQRTVVAHCEAFAGSAGRFCCVIFILWNSAVTNQCVWCVYVASKASKRPLLDWYVSGTSPRMRRVVFGASKPETQKVVDYIFWLTRARSSRNALCFRLAVRSCGVSFRLHD